jgi:hypothetical protein
MDDGYFLLPAPGHELRGFAGDPPFPENDHTVPVELGFAAKDIPAVYPLGLWITSLAARGRTCRHDHRVKILIQQIFGVDPSR